MSRGKKVRYSCKRQSRKRFIARGWAWFKENCDQLVADHMKNSRISRISQNIEYSTGVLNLTFEVSPIIKPTFISGEIKL